MKFISCEICKQISDNDETYICLVCKNKYCKDCAKCYTNLCNRCNSKIYSKRFDKTK